MRHKRAWMIQSPGPQGYMITHCAIVAGGVMLAGFCWEVDGKTVRPLECKIFWFAMFSHFDRVVDLMEGTP